MTDMDGNLSDWLIRTDCSTVKGPDAVITGCAPVIGSSRQSEIYQWLH